MKNRRFGWKIAGRRVCFACLMMILAGLLICFADPGCTARADTRFSTGRVVTFGKYEQDSKRSGKEAIEWIVLDVRGREALLISRYGLEYMPFDRREMVDVSWAESQMRNWLNDDFYYSAFSSSERNSIVEKMIDNGTGQGRSEWRWSGYGMNTKDRVFLLSYNEVMSYFSTNRDRVCYGSQKANGGKAEMWWIRTPGFWGKEVYMDLSACVARDGDAFNNGDGNGWGHYEEMKALVRPAIWVQTD